MSFRNYLARLRCLTLTDISASLPGTFRVSKMTTILARRYFERPLKDIAHRVYVSKTAFARDRVHAVLTLLQSPPGGFDPQPLDKSCWRRFHLLGKDPREIARTHRDAFGQHRHGERFIQVVEHPCLEFSQRLAIGQLQR